MLKLPDNHKSRKIFLFLFLCFVVCFCFCIFFCFVLFCFVLFFVFKLVLKILTKIAKIGQKYTFLAFLVLFGQNFRKYWITRTAWQSRCAMFLKPAMKKSKCCCSCLFFFFIYIFLYNFLMEKLRFYIELKSVGVNLLLQPATTLSSSQFAVSSSLWIPDRSWIIQKKWKIKKKKLSINGAVYWWQGFRNF